MDPGKTNDWLDYYSLVLDRLAEMLADPKKAALRMGITEKELNDQQNAARLPGKMDMDAYHELQESWKRVKRDIKLFGLALGDDLMLSPLMQDMAKPAWKAAPYLEVSRGDDRALAFYGRDALTAIGFFNFFVQQCDQVDPSARVKKVLEVQGVTKENFRERMFGVNIANPWESDIPPASPTTP